MPIAERKLTTILAADVEGYTRLMGRDEEGTFETLKVFRDAMRRHVTHYGGRVVNTWGDGLLADFGSVVSAVRAAIDAQGEFAERNAGKPRELQMLYRIGINLGDVIVEKGDLYGDGVNVAARLQSEAKPGGILISQTVYDQVRSKLSVGFEFLGNLDVKNVQEGVPAFAVRLGGLSGASGDDVMWGRAGQRSANPDTSAPGDGLRSAAARSRPAEKPGPVRPAGLADGLGQISPQVMLALGLVPAALVGINVVTWSGTFWAVWPLLVYALLVGLYWASSSRFVDRPLASLAVVGLFLAGINLVTWDGYFWAIWPILALALSAGIRLIARVDG